MQELARAVGFLFLGAGALLLAFPESARRLIKVRAEFAHLSPGALRVLGGWYLLTGALLVSATTRPAVEARVGEVTAPELRRAA